MTESIICVHGMICTADGRGVEKRLKKHPGIHHVEANFMNCTATVHYDESAISLAEIKKLVGKCGYHCSGESLPDHQCKPDDPPGVTGAVKHTAHGEPAAHTMPAVSQEEHDGHTAPGAKEGDKHADHDVGGEAAAMAHEMGHGPGMSMEGMVRDMRNRFFVAILLTIPVFFYSPLFYRLFNFVFPTPIGISPDLVAFLIATPVILYGGWPFYTGAYRGLKNGILNMAVLVSIAVLAGYIFSVAATFFFKGEVFYEAAVMLLTFVLFGHWMEMRARSSTSQAIQKLLTLAPPLARVERDGQEVEIPTSEVMVGDVVVIRPGDKVPVDGKVLEGKSEVDESMITGESQPVKKQPGAEVIGATINKTGSFKFRATRVGADTALSQIVKMVQSAQNSKAPSQQLADRAAHYLVLVAVFGGLLTFAMWYFFIGQTMLFAMTLAITVVVIT